nr:MAG TPA: hypothetical protein [Caudoviricetes sp.]
MSILSENLTISMETGELSESSLRLKMLGFLRQE